MKDVPSDKKMIAYIREAMKLNVDGIKLEKKPPKPQTELVVPDYLKKAIAKNKEAKATFEGFSNGKRKEYVEWITEAKTEATREKRMATAIQQMSEGKSMHWKYQK